MIEWTELRKERHSLELEGCDGSRVQVPGPERDLHAFRVWVKWDGCLEITQCSNGYEWDHECSEMCQCLKQDFHICDIDQMIAALQEIKKRAQEHFGEEFGGWPG